MQTILPSEFKRQMVLMLDGSPHVIEDMHTSGTAQTRHKLHTRLRHLTTGRLIDRVFAENERVPVAPLETRRATYSYAKADVQVFIDIVSSLILKPSTSSSSATNNSVSADGFSRRTRNTKPCGSMAGCSTSSCRRKYRSRWWKPLRPPAPGRPRHGRRRSSKLACKSWSRCSSPTATWCVLIPPGRSTWARNRPDGFAGTAALDPASSKS